MANLQVDEPRVQTVLNSKLETDDSRLQKIIDWLQARVTQPMSSNKFASMAGISTRQHDRIFMQQFNLSAKRYYLRLRLQQASWSIGKKRFSLIAYQTMFCYMVHFLRHFRAHFGETLGDQRHRVLQDQH